ncbi:MAG: hypothetical protein DRI52_05060 [Chloroflexi bacterium]|nr:MAG: hypothetical protein DRI52_05060 [Chloroflexota bacterium]
MSNNIAIAVRITADGKIPLPKKLQQELGLEPLQEVNLSSQGDVLIVQRSGSEIATQDRATSIVQRAKVRAAVLAGELTRAEAWAIYDEAAVALRQALQQNQREA